MSAEEAPPEEFKQAIREVHAGSVWVPRRVLAPSSNAPRHLARRGEAAGPKTRSASASVKSCGCWFQAAPTGKSPDALGIEERTVKAHVAQLLRKVGVQNRIALSVHAVTHSLLSSCASPIGQVIAAKTLHAMIRLVLRSAGIRACASSLLPTLDGYRPSGLLRKYNYPDCTSVILTELPAAFHTAFTYHRTWETGLEEVTRVSSSGPSFLAVTSHCSDP